MYGLNVAAVEDGECELMDSGTLVAAKAGVAEKNVKANDAKTATNLFTEPFLINSPFDN